MAAKYQIPNEIINKILSYIPENKVNKIMKNAIKKYFNNEKYEYDYKFIFCRIRFNENKLLSYSGFEKKFYYTILHIERRKIINEIKYFRDKIF
jgi:hypothetical protein